MKKLLKLALILFLLLTVGLFNSCIKDDPTSENKPVLSKKCYINKVLYGDSRSEEFFYDADNKLQKIIIIEDGGRDTQIYNLVYDNIGRIIQASQDDKGIAYIAFNYNTDNTISSVENIFSNINQGYPYQIAKFEYNGNKKVRKVTVNSGPNGAGDFMYIDYVYDTKGNITSQKIYYKNEVTKEWNLNLNITSEYDDKKSPLFEIKVPPINNRYYALSNNNAIKQNTYSSNSTWKMTATIQYIPEGYPQKISYKDADGNYSHTTTCTYSCE